MLVQKCVVDGPVGGEPNDFVVSTASLTQFTLCARPELHQTWLHAENPFCRLAARTPQGSQVCNKGCGMTREPREDTHHCPFGLAMRRAGAGSGSAESLWIGRRFPSVRAMHAALDRMAQAGVDEEAVLAHLPPNPVVSEAEMELAPAEPAAPAKPSAEQADRQLANLVDYIAQVHKPHRLGRTARSGLRPPLARRV